MDDLANKIFQTLGFYISTIWYLQGRFLRFIDVTDLELNANLTIVDSPGQVVTDSEEEVLKKKNKRMAKNKEQLLKLCYSVGYLLSL